MIEVQRPPELLLYHSSRLTPPSGAADSRSDAGAEAIGCRLQANVRLRVSGGLQRLECVFERFKGGKLRSQPGIWTRLLPPIEP